MVVPTSFITWELVGHPKWLWPQPTGTKLEVLGSKAQQFFNMPSRYKQVRALLPWAQASILLVYFVIQIFKEH